MAVVQTLIGNVKGPAGATGATGATGPQGDAATIAVGSVTSAAYGTPASVTNSGTSGAAVFDFVIPQGKPGEKTTKMGELVLDTITTSTDEFPSPAVDDTGAIAFGKIRKFFADTLSALAAKIDTSKIANNLTTTDTSYVLSAAQGKALNDSLGTCMKVHHKTHSVTTDANGGFQLYNKQDAYGNNYGVNNLLAVFATGCLDNVYCVISTYNSSCYCMVKINNTNAVYANKTLNVDIVSYTV